MSTIPLDAILESVKKRSAARRRQMTFERLEDHVKPDSWRRERVLTALTNPELTYICEMSRLSPASGPLLVESGNAHTNAPSRQPRIGPKWQNLAAALKAGGAEMLSVVTEEDHFGGTLDDLRTVEFTRLPRLRRDFIVDECMVLEGSSFGADAVVLTAAILDDPTLTRLRAIAKEYGITVLLEVHDERELERALVLEPELVLVNARDWRTQQVDLAIVERLLPLVPKGILRVAEGNLAAIDELKRVRAAGADVALVGESLVRDPDPAATLQAWKSALRGH